MTEPPPSVIDIEETYKNYIKIAEKNNQRIEDDITIADEIPSGIRPLRLNWSLLAILVIAAICMY